MDTLRDKNGKFKKGNVGFWFGKKRESISGNKNYNWKGGKLERYCISCGKKYLIWRCEIGRSKFCSASCRSRYNFLGDKNPLWKGGVSKGKDKFKNSVYYYNWRAKVFRRDKWVCKLCGYRSKKSKAHGDKESDIHAHHIIPMEINIKLCLKVGNGITLCKKCHRLTYGKEEKFAKVFKEILRDYMPKMPKG